MQNIQHPFANLTVKEIPLLNPPLLRVIVQVRFPLVMEIETEIAPFQKAIKAKYPILKTVTQQGIVFSEQGMVEEKGEKIWQFFDREEHWMASLAPGFLALETLHYNSRSDLLNRMQFLLEALLIHYQPPHVVRLGVRYIDRIEGAALEQIDKLLQPAILGVATPEIRDTAQHILTEMQLKHPTSGALRARWGFLPKSATVDPLVIEPIERPSWLLDIDAFCNEKMDLNPTELQSQLLSLTQYSYAFFRWAVTDTFLAYYQQERGNDEC